MEINNNSIFQCLSDGVYVLDVAGRVTWCNDAASRISGYAFEEIKNKPLHLLDDGDGDAIQYQYELDQARQHSKLVAEGWRRRKDGTRFWCEISYTLVAGQHENARYCVLLRDIFEKKQQEWALQESEERYRLMVEAVRDYSILMLDAEGFIRSWNDGGTAIQGYSESEVLGRHFSMFYTFDDLYAKKPERELDIARRTGTYREEGWRVRKGGSLFWASVVLTALFNEQNKFIGYSKVTRDLTDQQQNEKSLRESEARYRSLVEQVGDYGIFMLDTKGRIISWNEGAKRIKGYAAEDVIGKYFSIFYTEEDILGGKPARELRIARATGKYEEEGWRLRKDGSRFWANIVITSTYDQEHRLAGFSKVTRDLTERKLAEQTLQESSNKYRQLARELLATNEELSAVNKELEEFTAIVSHDLKEPVRTVKSFLHLIVQHLQQERYDLIGASVKKSIQGAQRMQDLIDNLLHYSQISKITFRSERLSLTDIISEAEQNLESAIEKSHAKISMDLHADQLFGDRVQLVQLFQNLLSNALKFTDKNTPEVTVRSWMEEGNIRIVVTDNGIGIPPEHLEKVFGVFKRLHFAHQYPGTGVGLAICKKVIERLNGRIWAESGPGQGASFHITLPESNPIRL